MFSKRDSLIFFFFSLCMLASVSSVQNSCFREDAGCIDQNLLSVMSFFTSYWTPLVSPRLPHLAGCHITIRIRILFYPVKKHFDEGIQVQAVRLPWWCIVGLSVGHLKDLADYGVKSHCDRSLTPAALCKPPSFHLVRWSLPSSLSLLCPLLQPLPSSSLSSIIFLVCLDSASLPLSSAPNLTFLFISFHPFFLHSVDLRPLTQTEEFIRGAVRPDPQIKLCE